MDSQNSWQTQHAKTHFSEVIKRAIHEGDQFITHHGEEVAVIISKSRYDALLTPSDSLIEFFYSAPYPSIDLEIERKKDSSREFEL